MSSVITLKFTQDSELFTWLMKYGIPEESPAKLSHRKLGLYTPIWKGPDNRWDFLPIGG